MATTVQSFVGGGGTDLTELTSGELLLIFLLNNEWISATGDTEIYHIVGLNHNLDTGFRVDLSRISTMTFQTQNLRYPDSTRNLSWSSVSNDGDYSFGMSQLGEAVRCTSFTTIDGKVHTADNLNY